MAFVLKPIDEITTTIKVSLPNGTSRPGKADFDATFKKLSFSQAKDLLDELRDKDSGVTDDDLIRDHLIRVDGIKDEHGANLEVSESLLDYLLDHRHIRRPLIDAFIAITWGDELVEALRQKN